VIRTIAEDEPVTLLAPPDLVGAARARFAGAGVEIVPAPVDDVWMRDIAPVFAKRGDETVAIDLNFNGWDNSYRRPSRPGDRLARTFDFGVPVIGVPFVGEGGPSFPTAAVSRSRPGAVFWPATRIFLRPTSLWPWAPSACIRRSGSTVIATSRSPRAIRTAI